ncbi:galactitol-1-phosphate 5-dehydrogenase [Pelosinus baikalensis]|uniref:Galactitol-1-phosphate 5-dehydrogenase n=1 Tax=Pelosinus baikalensis TaxID=2892015 RepID=A0ABS8HSW9_9FIRM|nr:galactitol-1-phosphate 5-dehydrogenase [Pelosinus baikalensis]
MKGAKIYGIRDLRVEECPKPEIKTPDDVIVKVKAVGFCGSDISRYGKLGPHTVGAIFGHELSGEIVEIGEQVTNVKVGDGAVVCPTTPCFHCEYCQLGKYSKCESLQVIGAKEDGGFAEYVRLHSRSVLKMPEGLDFETACGMEPACVVMHGFYRTKIQAGDTVAVLGVGPIGLFAVQCAKIFGATKVIAIDIFDEKLEIAKELGADLCINAKDIDPIQVVKEMTGGIGVDIAVESAGNPFTSAQVLSLPKKGGTVVFMGIPYGDVAISREHFEKIVRNELTVLGSWNAVSGPFPGKEWPTTLHFMKEGKIKVKPMVTHRISLDQIPETFEKIYKRDSFFGKVIVFPEGKEC